MPERPRPFVTIGISTFNRADGYLADALGSAVAQTYPDLEILVSDNCSDDHTPELVAGFDDPRIRYHRHEKNIGANANFNFCVQEARGEYFLLLHDDDMVDPDFVEACVEALPPSGRVGIVITGARVIDAQGRAGHEKRNELSGAAPVDLFVGWFRDQVSLYLCSTLYNTDGLRRVGGFSSPRSLYQDVVATARLSSLGRADVPEVKASFRRHGDNMGTAATIKDWADDSRFVIDTMCEIAPEHEETIRHEGMRKLCRVNYFRASRIPGQFARWQAFWTNYREFDSCYSPLAFGYRRKHKRFMRRLERLVPALEASE
jgi:glycosyltransferase involved in cell wall biosynthesis